MTRRDTFGSAGANKSQPSELELKELMRSRSDAKRGVDRVNMTLEIVKYAAIIIALVLGIGRLLTRSNAPTLPGLMRSAAAPRRAASMASL